MMAVGGMRPFRREQIVEVDGIGKNADENRFPTVQMQRNGYPALALQFTLHPIAQRSVSRRSPFHDDVLTIDQPRAGSISQQTKAAAYFIKCVALLGNQRIAQVAQHNARPGTQRFAAFIIALTPYLVISDLALCKVPCAQGKNVADFAVNPTVTAHVVGEEAVERCEKQAPLIPPVPHP